MRLYFYLDNLNSIRQQFDAGRPLTVDADADPLLNFSGGAIDPIARKGPQELSR
jgi:hypothetical protein